LKYISNIIKILHLIKSLGRGGAEMLLPETLRVHDRERFSFAYAYCVPHKDQLVPMLTEQGAEVRCFPATNPLKLFAQTPAIARYARDWGADLIHCHLPLAGVVGRWAGRWAGIPVVYTEHNKQERYHPLTRRLNLATMGGNARVLAVSDNVLESLREHWSGPAERSQLLLNGVNTRRFDPGQYDPVEARRSLGLPVEAPIIGTVCVFRTQKRLPEWLALARRVKDTYPAAHFVLVGDGPEEDAVRARAAELDLTDCLHLPGRLEEVRPWLAALDVYLMSSEFEGLPIAMLEAMSMGLPVVATRAGGIGEVVREGQEGFLSSVAEWERLEKPLLRLVGDAPLREELGAAARRRVVESFSIERMARSLEEVYLEVLEEISANR
jgi:glycosyltransferase involved in cell wall biosynthesis